MTLSITTRWNANRHTSGEEMVEEILRLGFTHIELGFDLSLPLVPGVKKMVENKAVIVDSLHSYCPLPISVPYPSPEIFLLASLDRREQEMAISNLIKTINFAAEIGAKCVIIHAGRVEMRGVTSELVTLCREGRQYDSKYDKLKLKLLMDRDKKAAKHIEALYKGIEELLPAAQKTNVAIAFENLPSWEAVPSETEMEAIGSRFNSPLVRYWHDMGHGQIRQNLGFISHKRWLEKLAPLLAGFHVHDVLPPANDHLMPPKGKINFADFKGFINPNVLLVLEPSPNTPEADIRNGIKTITEAWGVHVSNEGRITTA